MKQARLLPVLILVATLTLALRIGDVVTGVRQLSGAAQAEDAKASADTKPAAGDAQAAADKKPADTPATEGDKKPSDGKDIPKDGAKDSAQDDTAATSAKAWPDPAEMDPDLADVKSNLAKDLANRRKQLDDREKQLATREAVLKAAESELDQKYNELTELRKQLQGLLDQQSQEEASRIKSLVQIYEGMKPADAARIFNTLDLNVLLEVMSRMSERKTAPVLAAMEPDRARTITMMMAQQKKLPELPDLSGEAGANNPPPAPKP